MHAGLCSARRSSRNSHQQSFGLLFALLALFSTAFLCSGHALRVRQELRELDSDQYKLLVVGLSTLLTISTEQGQLLFGESYKEYDYFLVKHAVAVNDPRGDQGHAQPCFMTFHRSWLLEFEAALLSVVPKLGALPYWDIVLDSVGQKYYGTHKWIFSNRYAGSGNYDNDNDTAVSTGILAWREIHYFNDAIYGAYADIYNGSQNGQLRSQGTELDAPYVTRFPIQSLVQFGELDGHLKLPFGRADVASEGGSTSSASYINFTQTAYDACLDPTEQPGWIDWLYCVDVTAAPPALLHEQKLEANSSSLLHAAVHWFVGGIDEQGLGEDGVPIGITGDFFDLATSPNEVLMFFLHHANIDRNNMIWQRRAAEQDPDIVSQSWGYPASLEEYNYTHEGCLLHDVISSYFPFTDIFEEPPEAEGYTHYEVLAYTSPSNVTYTYDNMQ